MTKRPVITNYLVGRNVVKTTRSSDVKHAVLRCVHHMQENTYAADFAEVWDETDGRVAVQVKFHVTGDLVNKLTVRYGKSPRPNLLDKV